MVYVLAVTFVRLACSNHSSASFVTARTLLDLFRLAVVFGLCSLPSWRVLLGRHFKSP